MPIQCGDHGDQDYVGAMLVDGGLGLTLVVAGMLGRASQAVTFERRGACP